MKPNYLTALLLLFSLFFFFLTIPNIFAVGDISLSMSFSPSAVATFPTYMTIDCGHIAGGIGGINNDRIMINRSSAISPNGVVALQTNYGKVLPASITELLAPGSYNYTCAVYSPYDNATAGGISTNNFVFVNPPENYEIAQLDSFASDYANDTCLWSDGVYGGGFCYTPVRYNLITNPVDYMRYYQRWDLNSPLYNFTTIKYAFLWIPRYSPYTDYNGLGSDRSITLGAYPVLDKNVNMNWREVDAPGQSESICGENPNDYLFNTSCYPFAESSVTVRKVKNATYMSYEYPTDFLLDVTKLVNFTVGQPTFTGKQFTVMIGNLTIENENLENNRYAVTTRRNYPNSYPHLILIYTKSISPSLSLSASPSFCAIPDTTVSIGCSRVSGDVNSYLSLGLNTTYGGTPFSQLIANSTRGFQSDVRFVNETRVFTYWCNVSQSGMYYGISSFAILNVSNYCNATYQEYIPQNITAGTFTNKFMNLMVSSQGAVLIIITFISAMVAKIFNEEMSLYITAALIFICGILQFFPIWIGLTGSIFGAIIAIMLGKKGGSE